jgi:hypothetical protein
MASSTSIIFANPTVQIKKESTGVGDRFLGFTKKFALFGNNEKSLSNKWVIKSVFASAEENVSEQKPESNRFRKVLSRIKKSPDYKSTRSKNAPYGTFAGRPVIGENSKINGGVYLGVKPQEAIVVDDNYGILKDIYDELPLRYAKRHGSKNRELVEQNIVQEVVTLVKEKLLYVTEEEFQAIAEREHFKPDQKVALDIIMRLKVGTDRHHVLLAAYLLEKCKQRGLIQGKVYLNGFYDESADGKEKVIYSSSTGDLMIFSPAAERKKSYLN